MPDKAKLILRLRNFEDEKLRNITTRVRFFRRDGRQVGDPGPVNFATGRQIFNLDFQRGVYKCRVAASRYEEREFFFPVRTGEPFEHELILPRRVRADWNARFVKWGGLGAQYKPLKKLLTESPRLDLKIKKNGKHVSLGSFADKTYDDDDQRDLREGKAGLLNMYAKLTEIKPPGMSGRSWWAAMQELLVFQRDRVIGIANPKMADLVKKIAANDGFFPFYGKAPATLHPKNIRAGLKSAGISGTLEKLFSVKTKEKYGVLQLTIGEVKTADGQNLSILDADIDENGRLLKHFGDTIKHRFTGGTHPFHVYDILHRLIDKPRLGYRLV